MSRTLGYSGFSARGKSKILVNKSRTTNGGAKMPRTFSNVDRWLKKETAHKKAALENASRHFDNEDALTVNVLEGIYGQESSFGTLRRRRNVSGAAGDFQLEKKTAIRLGLTVTKENDQRFDVDDSSAAAAKYLKYLDDLFRSELRLSKNLKTTPVADSDDRLSFSLAAFNAGEGTIAGAQLKAKAAGKDPEKWDDVKVYLIAAGAKPKKSQEIQNYVDLILAYAMEFSKKSSADKTTKVKKPQKIKESPKGIHWITKDGKHIMIGD
jgi:membrane-bound lytic murein transglycosylase MltF